MFEYCRNIHVYETDLMGIVHHSNYLRFCEEARVSWCQSRQLLDDSRKSIFGLVVYETKVKHLSPARYGDQISIQVQARVEKAKLTFQYRVLTAEKKIAVAETIHCRLNENFKVLRFEEKLLAIMEKELWTETWL